MQPASPNKRFLCLREVKHVKDASLLESTPKQNPPGATQETLGTSWNDHSKPRSATLSIMMYHDSLTCLRSHFEKVESDRIISKSNAENLHRSKGNFIRQYYLGLPFLLEETQVRRLRYYATSMSSHNVSSLNG